MLYTSNEDRDRQAARHRAKRQEKQNKAYSKLQKQAERMGYRLVKKFE